jgi:hypothetical protein
MVVQLHEGMRSSNPMPASRTDKMHALINVGVRLEFNSRTGSDEEVFFLSLRRGCAFFGLMLARPAFMYRA